MNDLLCLLGLHTWKRLRVGQLFRFCTVCAHQQVWDDERLEWWTPREP